MLGFIYLVLILLWIMVVIFLKCKKTITPHLAFTDNYADAAMAADRRPSVHVIHLPGESDDSYLENAYNPYGDSLSSSLRRHSHRSHRSLHADDGTIERNFPSDSVINPAYTHDDDYIINAPPPSYEEVMRQPDNYPKVHQNSSRKSSVANI